MTGTVYTRAAQLHRHSSLTSRCSVQVKSHPVTSLHCAVRWLRVHVYVLVRAIWPSFKFSGHVAVRFCVVCRALQGSRCEIGHGSPSSCLTVSMVNDAASFRSWWSQHPCFHVLFMRQPSPSVLAGKVIRTSDVRRQYR